MSITWAVIFVIIAIATAVNGIEDHMTKLAREREEREDAIEERRREEEFKRKEREWAQSERLEAAKMCLEGKWPPHIEMWFAEGCLGGTELAEEIWAEMDQIEADARRLQQFGTI
jgi:hypothetical protein